MRETEPGPNGATGAPRTLSRTRIQSARTTKPRVYLGMQGDMLIDPKAMRIAKIDGTLFKDVDFGWGILGRLYKGRKVHHRADETWAQATGRRCGRRLQFNGKILMIKSLTISSTETTYDFRPVPASLSDRRGSRVVAQERRTVVAENGGGVKARTAPQVNRGR